MNMNRPSPLKKLPSIRFGRSKKAKIRLLQWNVLADGLGKDGFLTTEFSPIYESSEDNSESYDAREFMAMVREAKEADKASGMAEKFSLLKKEEKSLKRKQRSDEGYEELEEKIAKLKKETDESQLVKLKKRFQRSPQLEKVDTETLDWTVRYGRLKRIVLGADPDVITFQEIDHVKQFLDDEEFSSKYTCMVDTNKNYTPPRYLGQKGGSQDDDLSPQNYFQHILDSRAAFAPKSYSNAHQFRSKRDSTATDIDDDGCVIFWKKDSLTPVELGFLNIPSDKSEKSEAVVAVTLQHIKTKKKLNVLTTHLPSGDEPKKELERLAVLENPSAEWTARRICLEKGSWTEEAYEKGAKFSGIASYVRHFAERETIDSALTIFALDANSRPAFPRIKSGSSSVETNVWDTIREKTNLESIWVQNSFVEKSGEPSKPEHQFMASVNKMRGPSSNQPSKIGEHQLELIDHVYTNGKKSNLVTSVKLERKETVATTPLLYESKEAAELDLYPNTKMPSDHLPVVVDITL